MTSLLQRFVVDTSWTGVGSSRFGKNLVTIRGRYLVEPGTRTGVLPKEMGATDLKK